MGTEFESSNPDGRSLYEHLRELYAETIERLREFERAPAAPSDHNPYPRNGRPAALDITPGWYAPPERWDLIADAEDAKRDYAKAHPSDGMWDVPPVKIPEPPGGWVHQDGTWWLVDDYTDHERMQRIVEDAMRRIGMNVPPRAIIPQIQRRGTTHDGK